MAISSEFRIGQHRDDDHEEDAPYFTFWKFSENLKGGLAGTLVLLKTKNNSSKK